MTPLSLAAMARRPGEFTIGAGDVSANEMGYALTGAGGPIKGFRVLSGTGVLVYEDPQGRVCTLGNVLALTAGDEITPEWGIAISKIHGTGNAVPSAGLSLRCVW